MQRTQHVQMCIHMEATILRFSTRKQAPIGTAIRQRCDNVKILRWLWYFAESNQPVDLREFGFIVMGSYMGYVGACILFGRIHLVYKS